MSTSTISEITLPNGDVCKLRDGTKLPTSSYNYVLNSLPYYKTEVKASNSWYYSIVPSQNSSTRGIEDGNFFGVLAAGCQQFQILKYEYYHGEYFGGVDFTEFHDGDTAMVSFEYISDVNLEGRGACVIVTTDSTSFSSYREDISLPATSVWKRVWFKGTIPEGWDAAKSTVYSSCVVVHLVPSGAANVKVCRVSLTKSGEQAQWLPNPRDVVGDYNHYNYLVNSLPNRVTWTRIGGLAKSNTGTGTSCDFHDGWYECKCTSYDSSLSFGSQRCQTQFYSQYSTNYTYPAVGNCIFSGWNDGDPFTMSVEVKSDSDFYFTGRPIVRAESGGTVIGPWDTLENTQLVRGDGNWHRIWISGIIPDGFMAVASTTANIVALMFTFIFAANQSILARKFMFSKGLARTDWVPGMMDTPGRVQWEDVTTGTNYTVGSNNYIAINRPSNIQFSGIQIVKVVPLYWSTNSGMFDIIPYNDTSNPTIGAYIVGASGTTVNAVQLRWYYMFNDVTGYEAVYS